MLAKAYETDSTDLADLPQLFRPLDRTGPSQSNRRQKKSVCISAALSPSGQLGQARLAQSKELFLAGPATFDPIHPIPSHPARLH